MIKNSQAGQALVTLLVIVVLVTTITTGAVTAAVINIKAASSLEQGEMALQAAQAGAETALLKLHRSSSYSGETLTVGTGTATMTVSGTNPKIIVSVGTVGEFKRKVQVTATYTNSVLAITSWSEIN